MQVVSNRFKSALTTGQFVVTCEVIPGRGAAEAEQEREFAEAVRIWQTGRVHAISITDNPGGNPALLADEVARNFYEQGIIPLTHFTLKDRNRNQLQAQLYAMQRIGLENLLVMTGDYPVSGWSGRSRPVFDLDPVQAIQLVGDMNKGLVQKSASAQKTEVHEAPANFFAGAVVNPFKYTEAESISQYYKLEKKLAAGAQFIVLQLGYDTRKLVELQTYLRINNYRVPLIANIFLLTRGAARLMQSGAIAGCCVSDELMAVLEQEAQSEDKGKQARLERAAKMVAIARGLGYSGVHIGGFGITAEVLGYILDRADALQEDWQKWVEEISYGRQGGFYCCEDKSFPGRGDTPYKSRETSSEIRKLMRGYGISRFFHRLVLTRDKGFYKILKGVMDRKERKKGLHRAHRLEHLSKTILYGCVDCGDCGLETCVYSCPMSQCPKCQRNGPCGGSNNGWCEVYPQERYCIYFKAYYRLKKYGELEKLDSYITEPNNWELLETSGWSNYTHERDNASKRLSLAPRGKR